MMQVTIIVVIVLLALLIAGFVIRRKHIKVIERMEQEKLQIQNRPIHEELTKVKALNMNGQTEEMFERWRAIWTEVMDVHMPKIDSLFFDAEELIDRFRFGKASAIERDIEEYIAKCEKDMSLILKELDELIGSEEKNRIEIEQLKENYRAYRKTILSHQHSFGPALHGIETKLDQFTSKFEQYDALTSEGNYLQAREIVIALTAESQQVATLIHEVPTVLAELQIDIPSAINELKNGQREMERQSYYLHHLEMIETLTSIENELTVLKDGVAVLEIVAVKERIQEINDEIDTFYDLLEQEVMAKKYVDKNCFRLSSVLNEVAKTTRELHDEAEYVQQSYRLSEQEAETPKLWIKKVENLQKRYSLLTLRVEEEKSAYSILQEELAQIKDEIEQIQEQQGQFMNTLNNLRIDENKTREQLEELKKLLHDTDRLLHKANIPGIPGEMDARLEEAEEYVYVVMQSLQEVPLNMGAVHINLSKAENCILEVNAKAKEMIENVMLIERIIQYGNRYRATHPKMHQKLLEAEEAFNQFRYSKALEDAAQAVEEVEPGAMKRIELLVHGDFSDE